MTDSIVVVPPARSTAAPLGPLVAPLAGLLIAQFVAALSATVVATSVPVIVTTLEGPASASTWLVAATILANTAATPIWGRLCDLVPAKRILLVAVGLFAIGSAAAALSPSTGVLLGARALQGVAISGIGQSSIVAIATMLAPRDRGRANGLLQTMQTLGTLLGPVVGGIVVQFAGWRWCFVIALPIAAVSIVVVARSLPRLPAPSRGGQRGDYLGAVLLATGVPAVLVAVTLLGDAGGATPAALALGGYGVAAILGLVATELSVSAPVVPLRSLRRRVPLLCAASAFLLGSTMFTGSVFVTQYLQLGLDVEPAVAGLLLAPMASGAVLTSWWNGRLLSRTAKLRPPLIAGAGLTVLGSVLLACAPLAPLPFTLGGALLLAAGLGPTLQNVVLAAQTAAPADRLGSASSTVGFFFALGGTVGLVAFGAVLTSQLAASGTAGAAASYAVAVPSVFLCSAAAAVVGFVLVLLLPDLRLPSALAG